MKHQNLLLICIIVLLLINVSFSVDPRILNAEKIKSLRNRVKGKEVPENPEGTSFNRDFNAEKIIRGLQNKGSKKATEQEQI
ncbi:Pol protein [Tieghemostelium lacteum]|uniref:Pol protein n=1 Tax=Tieghemostelium lacteum TaxID=361077 RepID=A0A151ZEN9_TIELA|nr:Pol protein [Tieghemostelium lacteum]|eukprot:KYQ92380.1 Pol protein [Tieghemostelium lacteum]